MAERPSPEFKLRWQYWLIILVLAFLVVWGGTIWWISASVGLGVACALLALRPYSRYTRIGLIVAALVLAGWPIAWIITQYL